MKYLVIIFSFLFVTSCGVKNVIKKDSLSGGQNDGKDFNYVFLDDVKDGVGLERAARTSDKKYFDFIMGNELGYEHGKPKYETVLETSDQVYYGIIKNDPKSGKAIIEPFYAAPIANIRYFFPGFQDIDGAHVKAKVFYSFFERELETKVKPVCPNSYSFEYKDYDITLVKQGIRVDAIFQGKCYEKVVVGKEVVAILNPSTLDVIQSYHVTKDTNKGEQVEEGYVGDTKDVLKNSILKK